MTSMVERVARALCKGDGIDPDESVFVYGTDQNTHIPCWTYYRSQADTVVANGRVELLVEGK